MLHLSPPESSKSRELDVLATFEFRETRPVPVRIELVCECKNYSDPVVFLTRPKADADYKINPQEYVFPARWDRDELYNEVGTDPVMFRTLGLEDEHYYHAGNSKAVQFCRLEYKGDWKAGYGDMYDSILYPLMKAFLFRRRLALQSLTEPFVWLGFPIVILGVGATIYTVDERWRASQAQHVTLVREFDAEAVSGTFVVDFVAKDHLKDFVESKIQSFAEAVVRRLCSVKP